MLKRLVTNLVVVAKNQKHQGLEGLGWREWWEGKIQLEIVTHHLEKAAMEQCLASMLGLHEMVLEAL